MRKNRREGYWRYYHLAHSREFKRLLEVVLTLVEEAGDPWPKPGRGRPSVHSSRKLAVLCILMVALDLTLRKVEDFAPFMGLPCVEPTPDHTTIHNAFKRIPQPYLEGTLRRTAELCLCEVQLSKVILAADSTGVRTDRYQEAEIALRRTRRRIHLKYHILAILDYNIISSVEVTDSRTGDSEMLPPLLDGLPPVEEGSILDADRACDSDGNCQLVYEKHLKPNIKQRQTHGRNRGLRFRRRAAQEFNVDAYQYRLLVEGIFGSEHVKQGLKTRFRLPGNQRKWGLIRAVGHNLSVLNRLQCANQLNIQLQPLLDRA